MKRILIAAGARPNFVKVAPLIWELRQLGSVELVFVHTGQHYDFEMSEAFLRDLEIPQPDHFLGVGSGSHAEQTARVMLAFEPIVLGSKPDCIVVVGDVNSTLACAITAAKLRVPIAHVEAGLRSFDRTMPEEINRVVTDSVSDYLFTPSEDGRTNLLREGAAENKIHFVGNIMIDTLQKYEKRARSIHECTRQSLTARSYALLTLHRPHNVDDPAALSRIMEALERVQRSLRLLFPVHPRTRARLNEWRVTEMLSEMRNVRLCEPLGYLRFVSLLCDAKLVLTDSGGIQEEATALGVPCLTLRENTERPVTVTHGTNTLVGTDPVRIEAAVQVVLQARVRPFRMPPLWDGRTAARIADVLVNPDGCNGTAPV